MGAATDSLKQAGIALGVLIVATLALSAHPGGAGGLDGMIAAGVAWTQGEAPKVCGAAAVLGGVIFLSPRHRTLGVEILVGAVLAFLVIELGPDLLELLGRHSVPAMRSLLRSS